MREALPGTFLPLFDSGREERIPLRRHRHASGLVAGSRRKSAFCSVQKTKVPCKERDECQAKRAAFSLEGKRLSLLTILFLSGGGVGAGNLSEDDGLRVSARLPCHLARCI